MAVPTDPFALSSIARRLRSAPDSATIVAAAEMLEAVAAEKVPTPCESTYYVLGGRYGCSRVRGHHGMHLHAIGDKGVVFTWTDEP